MKKHDQKLPDNFVEWFRGSSPYIHAHRGRTFVITFGGEAVADSHFANLIHDIALLHGLGIRVVLVHGARPQIEERLKTRNVETQFVKGLRITDDAALTCVKEAAGAARVEIEALLSMGLANSPMAGVRIRAASGNFVTAKPIGVKEGIDYCHTGVVRRVDAGAIEQRLESGAIAIVPPLGYSPTGEVFNLSAADVAASVATTLGADKLICLIEAKGVTDSRKRLITSLTPREVDTLLEKRKRLPDELKQNLNAAVSATRSGVKRCHLINRQMDGGLLKELFTRDGIGTLISAEPYEETRTACIDDVGGLLNLIEPLEQNGVLVRRSRELIETEIESFTLVERDGMVVACAAFYPYPEESMAELACVVVHPEYRGDDRGDRLLSHMENVARELGIERLFILTTQSAQWFKERGFTLADLRDIPMLKRDLYNYRRNSKVFIKQL
ncbi:MAG: amino-acid N-acetyltransferase [Candidatus Thiodiazotropha sp. 6PLUC2]